MKKPEIIVYAANGHCPPCMALKEWLTQMGIPFTIGDHHGKSIYSFPTLEINGERVRGFDRPLILELLTKYDYIK